MPREFDLDAVESRRRATVAAQFHAQPEVPTRRAAQEPVPLPVLERGALQARLPRVVRKLVELRCGQLDLRREGRDLDATAVGELAAQDHAVPRTAVDEAVERTEGRGARPFVAVAGTAGPGVDDLTVRVEDE